ncbi:MAG: cytochrome P450 [Pseudomonadota bacterium]
MQEKFIPPYPRPHKNKADQLKRFFLGLSSWIHTLYEKSYHMKLGEVRLPRLNIFTVNEKDLVHEVLTDREGHFPKHYVQHEMLCPLLGESVFSTNGEKWQKQRTMLNPAFAHTNLKRVFAMMQDASKELIELLEAVAIKDDYVHIDPIMTHVTADIIFRTILSKKLGAKDAHNIHIAFNKYQTIAQRITTLRLYGLPSFGLGWLADRYARHIHQVFKDITKERYDAFHKKREDGHSLPNDDILDALMRAQDPDDGSYFSFDDIIDQLSIIFLAGHETSASALTWSLYLLAHCPHLQQKSYEEIQKVGQISFETMRLLKITESVFQEALRLYPPVSFFPREAAHDMTVRDKNIAKGDMLTISPWLLHRNKNYWQEPHHFAPERFTDQESQDKTSIKSCFIPFGKGPRICIGAGFAKQEAVIILADIIKNFHISLKGDHNVEPVSRMTTRPKSGVYLRFKKRI